MREISGDYYSRWLHDPSSVSDEERMVCVILNFELLGDMEGFTHFFCYPWHLEKYPALRQALTMTRNESSLAVLNRFERWLQSHDVRLDADAIEDFICDLDEKGEDEPENWRASFEQQREDRWTNVRAHLLERGCVLKD